MTRTIKHHKTHKRGSSKKGSTTQTLHRLQDTQAGVLVSEEREKVVKECRHKVKAIAAECRAKNMKFRDVDFDLERDRERCLRGLAPDSDPDSDTYKPSDAQRVTQIFKKPRFYVGGADPSDIVQGKLGDCWFLSALATMSTTKDRLVEKFCVERDEKIGVYGFVFFRDAKWVAVIIDDFLYTSFPKFDELSSKERELYHNNEENYNNIARRHAKNLHFAKSEAEDPEETWVPLYEKAYAKLHGNYAALEGGYAGEAIEDLTGGVTSLFSTKDILSPDDFWRDEILHARKGRLFACSFDSQNQHHSGTRINGLIAGHAYSVLDAKEYNGKRFVVLRNPWGNTEWNGPWSDGSKEWSANWLPALEELHHSFGADGQFVMEYKDFLENWETIDRTLLFDSTWIMASKWLRVKPRPCLESSYGDVSFTVSLTEASPIIIVLSKLDDRYFRELARDSRWTFDFLVYKRGEKHPVAASSPSVFLNQRSVNTEFKRHLQAGEYIVHVRLDNQSPVFLNSEPVNPIQHDTSDESLSNADDSNTYSVRLNIMDSDPVRLNIQSTRLAGPSENDTSSPQSNRILSRVYAEKLKSQSTALNFDKSTAKKYLSTPLDTLAGKDLSELDDDDEERANVPLEEDREPVNSGITPGDNPASDESRIETEDEDASEEHDGVMVPEFLIPDKENTIVLGLRVYTQNTSSPVKIEGHCRRWPNHPF